MPEPPGAPLFQHTAIPAILAVSANHRETGMTLRRARKTLDLDPVLLEDVRAALGVRTDREAVTYALEQVRRQLHAATLMREFHGIGPIDIARIED